MNQNQSLEFRNRLMINRLGSIPGHQEGIPPLAVRFSSLSPPTGEAEAYMSSYASRRSNPAQSGTDGGFASPFKVGLQQRPFKGLLRGCSWCQIGPDPRAIALYITTDLRCKPSAARSSDCCHLLHVAPETCLNHLKADPRAAR